VDLQKDREATGKWWMKGANAMSLRKIVSGLAVAGFMAGVGISQGLSQEAPPAKDGANQGSQGSQGVQGTPGAPGVRGSQGAGNRPGRAPRLTMEQMRQDRDKRIKQSLGVTDEEWKTLQPKIENLLTLILQTKPARVPAPPAGGQKDGQTGPATVQPQSDLDARALELSALLANKESKLEDIKARLSAYRETRDKAKLELTKAQESFRQSLPPRQEAQLVLMGLLE
jgi:hypothetical protein